MLSNPDLITISSPKFRALILRHFKQLSCPLNLSNSCVRVNPCIQNDCLYSTNELGYRCARCIVSITAHWTNSRFVNNLTSGRAELFIHSVSDLPLIFLSTSNLWNMLQGPHERVSAFSSIEEEVTFGGQSISNLCTPYKIIYGFAMDHVAELVPLNVQFATWIGGEKGHDGTDNRRVSVWYPWGIYDHLIYFEQQTDYIGSRLDGSQRWRASWRTWRHTSKLTRMATFMRIWNCGDWVAQLDTSHIALTFGFSAL